MILFEDRRDAGRRLAAKLQALRGRPELVVLGIPRGGMVVADQVAQALQAPLDVWIVHKLGAPFNPELALGAVAGDGSSYVDLSLVDELGIPLELVETERLAQLEELTRRAELYRRGQTPLDPAGRTVILIDDGVATGATTIVALRALTSCHPARRILAVPVAPRVTAASLARECDELVLLDTPEPFIAVGRFYQRFDQVTDEEVVEILARGRAIPGVVP